MISDLGKHDDTRGFQDIAARAAMDLKSKPNLSKKEVEDFINGYNGPVILRRF